MKPETLEQLGQVSVNALKELGTWVDSVKSLAVAEMPKIAQEMVQWYIIRNAMDAVICVVVGIILLSGASRLSKVETHDEIDSVPRWAGVIIMLVVALILAVNGLDNVQCMLKGILAPRLVVIDLIKNLVK